MNNMGKKKKKLSLGEPTSLSIATRENIIFIRSMCKVHYKDQNCNLESLGLY